MRLKTLELWVGLLIVLGSVALFFLALQVSGLQDWYQSDAGFDVKVHFDDVGGLKTRSRVTMSGVTVGRVRSIDYDPAGYRAIVHLRLKDNMKNRIPKDSAASIRTAGLLGDNYIGIDPGSDQSMLKSGDEIHETHSALVLERLISQFLFNKDK